jgi:uncharacterized protein YgiB involved in biofilm formation
MRLSWFWIMLAGGVAVAAVVSSGHQNQPQTEQVEEQRIKIYPSLDACKAEQDAAACDQAFSGAEKAHESNAPRFSDRQTCEDRFGPAACQPYRDNSGGWFIPAMFGFMVGHALSGPSLVYQPVYVDRFGQAFSGAQNLGVFRADCANQPGNLNCSSGARYGSSGYIYNSSSGGGGGSTSGVWTSGRYGVQTTTRTVARGGFGSSSSIVKPLSVSSSPAFASSASASSGVSRGGFGATAFHLGGSGS